MDRADFGWLEQALDQPVIEVASAEQEFGKHLDVVTLGDGSRVAPRQFRRREDAEWCLRILEALRDPAADRGIALAGIRLYELEEDPPWVVFEVLPGAAGEESVLRGPNFPRLARAMGETLVEFSELPCADVELDDMWARPRYLAARADAWAECLAPALSAEQVATLERVLAELPALFEGRPAVLAHGDYAPVNILVHGDTVTGLLDVEFVRVADPLYDAAWWAWSVGLCGADVLAAGLPEFLAGMGLDPAEPVLAQRIRSLQLVRTLEILADADLPPGRWRAVHERLIGLLGQED
ncbi:phosphotransferase family protein [Nocardia alni]|uniref:phosphotransferase family protein n=1 Tax=Nocardia alni TaxID=2815723 RepID=UPI001C250C3E|nr:aminoglycoside phosphotransferase family protein [Nocardia alni]